MFKVADINKVSKRKASETIQPLYNKYEKPDEWRYVTDRDFSESPTGVDTLFQPGCRNSSGQREVRKLSKETREPWMVPHSCLSGEDTRLYRIWLRTHQSTTKVIIKGNKGPDHVPFLSLRLPMICRCMYIQSQPSGYLAPLICLGNAHSPLSNGH